MKKCKHTETFPGCRLCWLFDTNEAYRNSILNPKKSVTKTTKAKKKSLPCIYVGKPAPPPIGGDVRKQWYVCDKGLGVVCTCNCNSSKCNFFVADI